MKKRRNGEGTIMFEKSRNCWRATITTPDGKRPLKRFKAEQDALGWLTEQRNTIAKGTFVSSNKITVGEWALEWLGTYKKGSLKQRTYETYVSQAKTLEKIADIRLQDLKPLQVQKIYKDLMTREKPLSACSVHKTHKLLKDMITKAYSLEMVKKNIMDNVSPPRFEKKEIEIFTPAQIEKILEVCYSSERFNKYYPIILLLVTTGARRGEILGLRWIDILLNTSEIFIRQALQESAVLGLSVEIPKTKTSIRKISITQPAVILLKKIKNNLNKININQNDFCFLTANGTPIRPSNIQRDWGKILELANIPYKKLHTLRHTHATELLAAGVPIIEVARRLGHSKISHTLELYGHSIPNYDQKIAGTVQDLYRVPQ